MFPTNLVYKTKTHNLLSKRLFLISCRLLNNEQEYDKARQAAEENIIGHRTDAKCMLDNYSIQTYIHKI